MKNNKIIHYFFDDINIWERGHSSQFKMCYASWLKFCPDYEIKLWHCGMEEFQQILKDSKFVRKAYEMKLWALIADYIRHYALYHYGGIYLDTDIQLVKNLDEFLDKDFFCSIEGDIFCGENIPESAFLGGIKGHPIFKKMLDIYNSGEIFGIDYLIDPIVLKKVLKEEIGFSKINYASGLEDRISQQYRSDVECKLMDDYELYINQEPFVDEKSGVTIYPEDYFCPSWSAFGEKAFTENTAAIHWNQSSWWGAMRKLKVLESYRYKNPLRRFMYREADRIAKIFTFFILNKKLRHKLRNQIETSLK